MIGERPGVSSLICEDCSSRHDGTIPAGQPDRTADVQFPEAPDPVDRAETILQNGADATTERPTDDCSINSHPALGPDAGIGCDHFSLRWRGDTCNDGVRSDQHNVASDHDD